jgi:hypothetical protein
VASLAREETIERSIGEMESQLEQLQNRELGIGSDSAHSMQRSEDVVNVLGRYTIGARSDNPLLLPQWLTKNQGDPATTVCSLKSSIRS